MPPAAMSPVPVLVGGERSIVWIGAPSISSDQAHIRPSEDTLTRLQADRLPVTPSPQIDSTCAAPPPAKGVFCTGVRRFTLKTLKHENTKKL